MSFPFETQLLMSIFSIFGGFKYKVLVKNIEGNVQRVAQVVVLDPPGNYELAAGAKLPTSCSYRTMLLFPSCSFPSDGPPLLDQEIAYLSPLLAFNLDLHVSCLKSVVHQGNDALASLFQSKADVEIGGEVNEASAISIRLEPLAQLPRYASHLRISFVKIPECGTLESLKGSSSIEAEDRQEIIDLALHSYFKVDRCLARGDIFNIRIGWSCNSIICVPCNQRSRNSSGDIVYFKVNMHISFLSGAICSRYVSTCQAII